MTEALLETLSEFEQAGETFTSAEIEAIGYFTANVHDSGLRDCFSAVLDIDHLSWHESEYGTELTRSMLREHAGMLNAWYLALDGLMGDILTCTTEFTRYSPAATRYVKAAADDYHQARQSFEHVTTLWALALNTGDPNATYPPATRSVNFMLHALSSE